MPWGDNTTLFIFLDESGNLDFSLKGTAVWSLTAFCTFDPVRGRETFWDLTYSLAHEGIQLEYFHATEDKQAIRDQVFSRIAALADDFEIHSVIAEKRKANPSLYTKRVLIAGSEGAKPLIKRDLTPTRFYESSEEHCCNTFSNGTR